MALEDIAKLREKVDKDPNSKLFVPLADEYRKMGMFDEAVDVLLRGLEEQPGYMSARVSLGKIYLEKKMMAQAKEEFEKVISAIPDNLFAHKKLAEIYRDSGDKDRAVVEYKSVLRLNPFDEDAMSNLEMIQRTQPRSVQEEPPKPGIYESHRQTEETVPEEIPSEEVKPEEIKPQEVMPEQTAQEEIPVSIEEEPLSFEEKAYESPQKDDFEKFKKSFAESKDDIEQTHEEDIEIEDIIPEEDMEEAEKETKGYVDMLKDAGISGPVAVERFEVEEAPESATPPEKHGIRAAEMLVTQGNYSEAMKIYRRLLSENPDDKSILQKVEELKMLLRMLGKTGDVVIEKLKIFEEGLKRRKDEFLGNS